MQGEAPVKKIKTEHGDQQGADAQIRGRKSLQVSTAPCSCFQELVLVGIAWHAFLISGLGIMHELEQPQLRKSKGFVNLEIQLLVSLHDCMLYLKPTQLCV